MMLDSSFCCALSIRTGAYSLIFSEIPSCMAILIHGIKMFDGFWKILYCTSEIHTGAHSPLLNEIVHRWMIIVGCLPHDFVHQISILRHISLSLMRLCIYGWSLLVVYLMTLTSNIHIGAYSSLLNEIVFGQWVVMYTLWDLPFEIHRHSSFSDTESSFSSYFSEVCHDASVSTHWFQRLTDLLVVSVVRAP